jgi:hypothetical protein
MVLARRDRGVAAVVPKQGVEVNYDKFSDLLAVAKAVTGGNHEE